MRARGVHASRRARGWRSLALAAALAVAVGTLGTALLSGAYQVRPVLSGSMRPGLPVGGVVITRRVAVASLQDRDVVVFARPDQPQEQVVHRITALTREPGGAVLQTQGDANDAPDDWRIRTGSTADRVVFALPLFGYAAVWTHSPAGRRTLLISGLLLLAGAGTSGALTRRHDRLSRPLS
jgi:signal peptidase